MTATATPADMVALLCERGHNAFLRAGDVVVRRWAGRSGGELVIRHRGGVWECPVPGEEGCVLRSPDTAPLGTVAGEFVSLVPW